MRRYCVVRRSPWLSLAGAACGPGRLNDDLREGHQGRGHEGRALRRADRDARRHRHGRRPAPKGPVVPQGARPDHRPHRRRRRLHHLQRLQLRQQADRRSSSPSRAQRSRYVAKLVATDQTRMLTLLKIDAKGLPVPAAVPEEGHRDRPVGPRPGPDPRRRSATGRRRSASASSAPSAASGARRSRPTPRCRRSTTAGRSSTSHGRVQGVLVPGVAAGRGRDGRLRVVRLRHRLRHPAGGRARRPAAAEGGQGPASRACSASRMKIAGPLRRRAGDRHRAAGLRRRRRPASRPATSSSRSTASRSCSIAQMLHLLGPQVRGRHGRRQDQARRQGGVALDNLELVGAAARRSRSRSSASCRCATTPKLGVEVRYVYPKSPAETAGLKAGDRIVKIGVGKTSWPPFTGAQPGSLQLLDWLNALPPGDRGQARGQAQGRQDRDADGHARPAARQRLRPSDAGDAREAARRRRRCKKALAPLEVEQSRRSSRRRSSRPDEGRDRPAQANDAPTASTATGSTSRRTTTRTSPTRLVVWLHPPGKNKDEDIETFADDLGGLLRGTPPHPGAARSRRTRPAGCRARPRSWSRRCRQAP